MGYRIVISLIVAICGLNAATEDDIALQLQQTMDLENMKYSERPPGAPRVDDIGREHGLALLPHLRPYMEADDSKMQFRAVVAMSGVLSVCDEPKERRQLVEDLSRWFCDPKCLVVPSIARLLRGVRAEDFSEGAKTALLKGLQEAQAEAEATHYRARYNVCILVVGMADIKEALPVLAQEAYKPSDEVEKTVAAGTQWRGTSAWAALKARARMGIKEDIELCIRFAEAYPDRDDRAPDLLKHFSYVRQPEMVEYIRPFLFSDHLYDVGDSIDMIAVSEGQWAAAALGQMLEGFPWTMDSPASKSALEECRAWMKGRTEYSIIR